MKKMKMECGYVMWAVIVGFSWLASLSNAATVLEWKFDGGSADDSSGNSYHGTVTEGTNGSVGFVDGTIEFSNAKDRVVSPSVSLSGAFTVGGWIKVEEGFAGSWNRFLCTDDHKTGFFIGCYRKSRLIE